MENKEDVKIDPIVQMCRASDRFVDTQKTISTRTTYIGFGLIALCFTLLSTTSENDLIRNMTSDSARSLLVLSLYLGVGAVVTDYLQNVFSYMSSGKAARNKAKNYEYTLGWDYQIAYALFWLKQVLALAGSFTFAFAFCLANSMYF